MPGKQQIKFFTVPFWEELQTIQQFLWWVNLKVFAWEDSICPPGRIWSCIYLSIHPCLPVDTIYTIICVWKKWMQYRWGNIIAYLYTRMNCTCTMIHISSYTILQYIGLASRVFPQLLCPEAFRPCGFPSTPFGAFEQEQIRYGKSNHK